MITNIKEDKQDQCTHDLYAKSRKSNLLQFCPLMGAHLRVEGPSCFPPVCFVHRQIINSTNLVQHSKYMLFFFLCNNPLMSVFVTKVGEIKPCLKTFAHKTHTHTRVRSACTGKENTTRKYTCGCHQRCQEAKSLAMTTAPPSCSEVVFR